MHLNIDIVHSSHNQLLCLLSLLLFWATLNYLSIKLTFSGNHVPSKNKLEARLLVSPLIHGVTTWLMATLLNPFPHYNEQNNNQYNFVCFYSATYFMVDLSIYWSINLCSKQLAMHHSMALVSLLTPLFFNYGAVQCVGALSVLEATNFPLNFSSLLGYMEMKERKVYKITRMSFYILYFWCRFPVGMKILFVPIYLNSFNCPIIIKLAGVGLLLQSLFVLWRILTILHSKIIRALKGEKYPNLSGVEIKEPSIQDFFQQN